MKRIVALLLIATALFISVCGTFRGVGKDAVLEKKGQLRGDPFQTLRQGIPVTPLAINSVAQLFGSLPGLDILGRWRLAFKDFKGQLRGPAFDQHVDTVEQRVAGLGGAGRPAHHQQNQSETRCSVIHRHCPAGSNRNVPIDRGEGAAPTA